MRWEVAAAGLALVGFWASSLWVFQTVRDGGPYWWWRDLLASLPGFVLCPAFAVSGLRHPRAAAGWRHAAGVILAAWAVSPQTWYVLAYLLRLAR